MSNTILRNNEIRVPFMGTKMNFIGGLDPLGLQNASEQAYSRLLPGLNNVTGLIRAYSFYPWLLNEYSKSIISVDPRHQKQFIRRAEFLNALIAQANGIEGINGGTLAKKFLDETDATSFELQKGIYNSDGSTEKTYWKYPFGIFGQYYLGSIRQIGIIEEVVDSKNTALGLYRATKQKDNQHVSGNSLAKSFNTNISLANKELYLRCIESGIVDRISLEKLKNDFNLKIIPQKTEEWELLSKLLISTDSPLVYSKEPYNRRKETISHLLKLASNSNQEVSDREFTMWAYRTKGIINGKEDGCICGWYYYQLNEYWQVACTAILHASLERLQEIVGIGWYPLKELLNTITAEIVINLKTEGLFESENDSIFSVIENIHSTEKNLYQETMRSLVMPRLTSALQLLFRLIKENLDNIEKLKNYVSKNQYDLNGDILDFMSEFQLNGNISIENFIHTFILEKIFLRHKLIAYRKMGLGNQSTEKFILEEGMIRIIDLFGPGFTGPRVGNLITYLKDLKLLNLDGKISKQGSEFLNELGYEI